MGSSTTAKVSARLPPDVFSEEAGAADGSSDCSPAADVDVVSGAVVAVSTGAVVVGAASDEGNVELVLVAAEAGAAVVDETESAPLAAAEVGAGVAAARTTTVPFIQGWGAQ